MKIRNLTNIVERDGNIFADVQVSQWKTYRFVWVTRPVFKWSCSPFWLFADTGDFTPHRQVELLHEVVKINALRDSEK